MVAYTESKARALGAKYGKGGPGMYIITWRPQVTPLPPPHLSSPPSPTALTASPPCTITAATPRPTPHSTLPAPQVEGDYVLKARLTSQADLPLFTKKISAKPPVTNGSLAAVRDAAVSQLRVVLPPEARRQVDREIGRRKQKLFRRSHEWRRADRRVRDAAREASAGAGDVESKVEAILADAERSAVTWRLRLSSSTGGNPEMPLAHPVKALSPRAVLSCPLPLRSSLDPRREAASTGAGAAPGRDGKRRRGA